MSAAIGTLTFDAVRGVITPLATVVVERIDNPGQTPAVVTIGGAAGPDRLLYRGFFTASQKAAAYALTGTVVNAADETGATVSVLVQRVELTERPARCGGSAGKWVELSAEVIAWA